MGTLFYWWQIKPSFSLTFNFKLHFVFLTVGWKFSPSAPSCCSYRKCFVLSSVPQLSLLLPNSLKNTHTHMHTQRFIPTAWLTHSHFASCCSSTSWSAFSTLRPQASTSAGQSDTVSSLTITYCVFPLTLINTQPSAAAGWRRQWGSLCSPSFLSYYISGCCCLIDSVTTDREAVDLQQVFVGSSVFCLGGLMGLLFLWDGGCRWV